MHIIAAKAVALTLTDEFRTYAIQLQKKCQCDSRIFIKRDYDIISGGTDNHMILIDLRNKYHW
jgi:glycine hydroxymethyltransferase